MIIQPLSQEIYNTAIELGVTKIHLHFSGGYDEGYLYIYIDSDGENAEKLRQLKSDIDDWVWDNYDYCGAGDSSSYGDNITYNLTNFTVTHREWWMARQEGNEHKEEFEVRR